MGGNLNRSRSGMAGLFLLCMVLAGCDLPPEPTPTPTMIIIPASPTVDPRPPTAVNEAVGGLEFTPGAPPLVGDATITPLPLATAPSLPISFVIGSGRSLEADFFAAPFRPAPVVLLLTAAPELWQSLAARLQTAGNSVLLVGMASDVTLDDLIGIVSRVRSLPGILPDTIRLVGAEGSANSALSLCAAVPQCRSLVLLTPRFDDVAAEAMGRYGPRPVLIAASAAGSDAARALHDLAQGERRLLLYEGQARGSALLTQPDLPDVIVRWVSG